MSSRPYSHNVYYLYIYILYYIEKRFRLKCHSEQFVYYMFTVIRYLPMHCIQYTYTLDLRVPDDNSRDNTRAVHRNTTRNYVVHLLVNLCGRTNPNREYKKKNPHEKCFSQKLVVPTLISRLIRSKYKRRLVIFISKLYLCLTE